MKVSYFISVQYVWNNQTRLNEWYDVSHTYKEQEVDQTHGVFQTLEATLSHLQKYIYGFCGRKKAAFRDTSV